jgi:DNA-binding NarL/FixJ family response regulator
VPSAVRVLMADDHPAVLAGMKTLVASDPNLQLVGEAGDGPSALALARTLRPNVTVLDLSMPGMNGIEVTAALRTELPGCRVMILSVHEDAGYLRQSLASGAFGYVLKRSAADHLVPAIHAVAAGEAYVDPAIAGKLAVAAEREAPPIVQRLPARLNEPESAVLHLVAAGHSNKQVALRLNLSLRSTEALRSRAMAKVGLRSRVELVRFARAQGWLAEDGE